MKTKFLPLQTAVMLLLSIGFGLMLGSCSDSDKEEFTPAQNQQKLILAALESDLELSKFTEAFGALDLKSSSAETFTIIALKNSAIEGELSEELLKRHIIDKAYSPSALIEAGKVKSLSETELIVKSIEGIISLNNTPLSTPKTVGSSVLYTVDEVVPVDNSFLGIKEEFEVAVSKVLRLRPEAIGLEGATFKWRQKLGKEKSDISEELNLDFITLVAGDYELELTATLPSGKTLSVTTTVNVTGDIESDYDYYPNRIYDFVPAPGQYVAQYGETKDKALNQVYHELSGGSGNVYMGAFGGYMVVGFDHTIINRPGYCDFTTQYGGGNASPSIIWVAYDANGNGVADEDEWYEIRGSEYGGENDLGMQSYTYSTTRGANENGEGGYFWTTQDGKTGYVTDPIPGIEVAVPTWVLDEESYTLSGRQLNPILKEGDPFFAALPFPWGYAANQPNGSNQAAIDIDWAVDAEGNSVKLPGIDFIKVVNALQGKRSMMGEYRYQVKSIEDLHLQKVEITTEEAQTPN